MPTLTWQLFLLVQIAFAIIGKSFNKDHHILDKIYLAAALIVTTTLPTPIAFFQDLKGSKYSPAEAQQIIEIAEGLDGRFAPYETRSEKAAAEKKIEDARKAEEARVRAEKLAAEKKAAEEAARIAAQEAAAEAERIRQANAAEEARKQAQTVRQAPAPAPARSYGGSCADWIAAAGIGDVGNAQELIRRESGCNPNAVNPSSGACGVAQELPCGKSGCSLGDGACQVRWMNSYVLGRYGSWANAVGFHDANNWY